MKLLTGVFSLITLIYLLVSYVSFDTVKESEASVEIGGELPTIPRLDENKLAAEVSWQALAKKKQEISKKKAPNKIKKVTPKAKKSFQIGDEKYTVYGIFFNDEKPFLILKNVKEKLIRLYLGEKLEESIQLVDLSTNSIEFKINGQKVIYKLFEANK